jgi:fructosamine-3-kinase
MDRERAGARRQDRRPVDPAIYCGHPEIESPSRPCSGRLGGVLRAYEGQVKLEPGFHEERREIYNLYPRLVHVRLFGSGYLSGIEATLARLGI